MVGKALEVEVRDAKVSRVQEKDCLQVVKEGEGLQPVGVHVVGFRGRVVAFIA